MSQSTETQVRAAFVGLDELQATVTVEDILHAAGPVRPVAEALPQRGDRSWSLRPVWVGLAAAAAVAVLIAAPLLWSRSSDAPPATEVPAVSTTVTSAPSTTMATGEASELTVVPLSSDIPAETLPVADDTWAATDGLSTTMPKGVIDGTTYAAPLFMPDEGSWLDASPDGLTFTRQELIPVPSGGPFDEPVSMVGVDVGLFWLVDEDDGFFRSEDALTWLPVDLPENGWFDVFHSIDRMIRNGDTILIEGLVNMDRDSGREDPAIFVSIDAGRSFVAMRPFVNARSLATGWTGTEYFAVAHVNQGVAVSYSQDAVTWSAPTPVAALDDSDAYFISHVQSTVGDRSTFAVDDRIGLRAFRFSLAPTGPRIEELYRLGADALPRSARERGSVWPPHAGEGTFTFILNGVGAGKGSRTYTTAGDGAWAVTESEGGTWSIGDRLYQADRRGEWRVAPASELAP